ncbi:Lrp/AsnC family transcriptional regulator [Altererythrobacter sp. ZODW24]|uniref:Lrp/AsnC family transcriptional regulator n=1 Tax=Altererythrobacter sp. ZODW24 TaxID=2185142 RepID=UPI000DF7BB34|nr:Lrp/AsnC family transcriptional regulator [Altererythrobacter sp. ZODW24]
MDKFDEAILKIVQADNRMTNGAIGDHVGLSVSAVRRRLEALRDSGIIAKDVAILNPARLGVTLIVSVTFIEDKAEQYAAFDKSIAALPAVKQSYHVSGQADYVLIVQGPSLEWYEEWSKGHLMSDPIIRRFETAVAWSCKKFETSIEL